MSARYTVRCDRCQIDPGVASSYSLADARRLLRRIGWSHPSRGRDLCPDCTKADAEKKPADPVDRYY